MLQDLGVLRSETTGRFIYGFPLHGCMTRGRASLLYLTNVEGTEYIFLFNNPSCFIPSPCCLCGGFCVCACAYVCSSSMLISHCFLLQGLHPRLHGTPHRRCAVLPQASWIFIFCHAYSHGPLGNSSPTVVTVSLPRRHTPVSKQLKPLWDRTRIKAENKMTEKEKRKKNFWTRAENRPKNIID